MLTGVGSYLTNSKRLPENLRAEDAKSSIAGHEPSVFNLALCRQHPVKRVPVFMEIAAGQQTVLPGDRQMLKTIGFDQLLKLLDGCLRDGKFAQSESGRDFSHAGRTDQNRVALLGNRFARGA